LARGDVPVCSCYEEVKGFLIWKRYLSFLLVNDQNWNRTRRTILSASLTLFGLSLRSLLPETDVFVDDGPSMTALLFVCGLACDLAKVVFKNTFKCPRSR
jgi:hypothetical protein